MKEKSIERLKVPFSPPRMDDLIADEVKKVLFSGWITTGPGTKLFEKKIAEYCNVSNALCLNSATAGLEVMLRWFGVKEGDEVILPAYTYASTANVVMHCGATPVFVDVNESDFNISVDSILMTVTKRTKVIIPVDFAGMPCDYNAINKLVQHNDVRQMFNPQSENQKKLGRIMILADAAHSFGASYHHQKSGSLTDLSVFSFHAVKNLTTAEGGAIALNLPEPFSNEEIYKYLCIYTLHGQNKDALAKMQKGNWRYDIIEPGFKCNMTDISAAIGLVELNRYDNDTLIKRKMIFDYYSEQLGKHDWAFIPTYKDENRTSSFHVFALRIKNCTEVQRDEIIKLIFEEGVSVNVHFIPIPMFSFYKNLGYNIADYPQTFKNYSCEISLPVFYDLTKEQMDAVVNAVVKSVTSVLNL
jgi:dTDP-4-amino-4,6-dideoxygalactose transaminase